MSLTFLMAANIHSLLPSWLRDCALLLPRREVEPKLLNPSLLFLISVSWEKVHLRGADKREWKPSVNCVIFIKNSALCKYEVQHYGFVGPVGEGLKMLINGI